MANNKVCLITGVGPGTGTSLVKRFAEGGYQIAMLARDAERLAALEREINGAHGYVCDVSDEAALRSTVAEVEAKLGSVHSLIHNAVGGAFGTFQEIDAKVLERNFQINTMALFHLAKLTVPAMLEQGEGVILATGNTSAYRGKPAFAGFAPTKAAQRILLESIARDVGPKGIHAAYIAIDAVIDVPWARKQFSDKPDSFFARPVDIASQCYHVAHQPKSTWSSEITIRPFGENW